VPLCTCSIFNYNGCMIVRVYISFYLRLSGSLMISAGRIFSRREAVLNVFVLSGFSFLCFVVGHHNFEIFSFEGMISVWNISYCARGVGLLAQHARHFISLPLAASTCICCNMWSPGGGGDS
jgi:hypothetical protein